MRQLPLELALMVLTTINEAEAPVEAQYLLSRSQAEVPDPERNRAMIELLTTIMVYWFVELSRSEVEAMLGLSLQETRFYQDAKEDGRQEGEQEGKQEGRQETLQQVVANLLNEGTTVDAIARITGLSPQQVQDLGTIVAQNP